MNTQSKIQKLPKSQVEIIATIPADILEKYRSQAVKRVAENVKIDGFRKGEVPEKILVAKIGEMPILEEMAHLAVGKHYVDILLENKIDAIGRPEITLTKLAAGNPVEYKIITAVLPEIVLPEYKKIAEKNLKEKKEVVVEDAEIEKTLSQLRKMRAEKEVAPHTCEEGEECSHEKNEIKEEDLPVLDDAFAMSIGDFKTMDDLTVKIKENMLVEKEQKESDRVRLLIMDAILEKTPVELPDIIVEHELDTMMHRMEGDIANMGIKTDDYLQHINKTREDMRNEWRPDAEKRALMQMVVTKIAEKENLKATEEELLPEITKVMENYKDADDQHVRAYVDQVVTNQKVFGFLEKGGKK